MLGWFSEARTLASRSKRASRSGSDVNASGSTLRATSRSSLVSRARKRFTLIKVLRSGHPSRDWPQAVRCSILLPYVFLATRATRESRRNCHPQMLTRHIPLRSDRHRCCIVSRQWPHQENQHMPSTPDEDYDVIVHQASGLH